MKDVYVRFGKVDNPKFTRVYEGVVKGDEIQLLMPKTSHQGARDILEEIGFGDIKIYEVTGIPVDSDQRDRIYLKNTVVVQELKYDPNDEKILVPQEPSFVDNITDDTPFRVRMFLLRKEIKRLWRKAKEEMKPEKVDTGEPIKDFFTTHKNS